MAEGAGNAVLALLDSGIPLADSQAELIPFQRFVILEGKKQEQERIEAQREGGGGGGMSGGGRGMDKNPMAAPNGGNRMSGDTVTYVNSHAHDDED